eukprot:TRINITY_DN27614_c0_g1_i1.p1 TRINITY_DN27614_c0_g1~~TRINITY_DN27614_c0_g1_i1.p1  ORF type:complete len:103 (+),score=15.11 TRINITY_DN27614_c0_g1_i1:19-327(+)
MNAKQWYQHLGKARRYQHEKGNWSVHIYIPINNELQQLFESLTDIITDNQLNMNEMHKMEEVHISLSISQPIRTHQISDFVDSMTASIKKHHKQSFNITFND